MRLPLVATGFLIWMFMPIPVSAQNQPTPAGRSTEIRITSIDGGRRTGRLVSLDATELVFQPGRTRLETRHKLSEVKLVETIHHNTRNFAIAGAAVGFGLAMAGDWCGNGQSYGSSNEPFCFTAMPALIIAAGTALGAAIGHSIDLRKRQILFVGPLGTDYRNASVSGSTGRWSRSQSGLVSRVRLTGPRVELQGPGDSWCLTPHRRRGIALNGWQRLSLVFGALSMVVVGLLIGMLLTGGPGATIPMVNTTSSVQPALGNEQ
jgi:hypothetical protein